MAQMNATQTLHCLTYLPIAQSILIAGDHGCGKSQTVALAAEQMGGNFIDLRLSQNDVGDLKGMPFHINGRTVFAPPDWFPLNSNDAKELQLLLGLTEEIASGRYGPKGILSLEEMNRAPREVLQVVLELSLDRRLNMRPLPDGWRVVATINDNSEIYAVNELGPALLSRFFLINFNPSIDEWLEWADKDKTVHPSVVQFIRKYPDFLDPTPEILKNAVTQGVVKVQDRRSWTHFGRATKEFEEKYEDGILPTHPLDKSPENLAMLYLTTGGFVGDTCAVAFKRFIETDYQALDADVILNKWTLEIKKKLKEIADDGRVPELGAYNEDIIAYIHKNVKTALSDKQGDNLCNYIELLPKEMVQDFWKLFTEEHREIAQKWYKKNPRHIKVIVNGIVKKKGNKVLLSGGFIAPTQ